MTPAENETFTQFLLAKTKEAKQDTGYPATQFVSMINAQGGEAAALNLLSATKPPSDGFVRLWEEDRLDLTLEALILESEWRNHFPVESLDIARKRLTDVKYTLNEFQPNSQPALMPSSAAASSQPKNSAT